MSDYIPLIVNAGSGQIQELPASDNLDLSNNSIVNAIDITANGIAALGTVRTDNYQYANGDPFSGGGGSPGGSNTQIQYNDNGSFGGIANLTYDNGTGFVTVNNANVTNANVTFNNFTELANSSPIPYYGGTLSFDAANGTIQTYDIYGTPALNASGITNVASGGSIVILMNLNSGTGTDITGDFKFAGNVRTLSSDPGNIDMVCAVNIGGTYYATLTTGYA